MTKSELIDRMVEAQAHASGLQLTSKDVELAVKTMLEQMSGALASGGRIEIRGFRQFFAALQSPPYWPQSKDWRVCGLGWKTRTSFQTWQRAARPS